MVSRHTKRKKPKTSINQSSPTAGQHDTRGRKLHNHVAHKRTPDEVLSDEIGKFFFDPLGYVMFSFPWRTERSIQVVKLAEGVEEMLSPEDRERKAAYRARFPNCEYGPDLWACDFLTQVGREAKKRNFNGRSPVSPQYYATVSGHEIGKSVLVAWITKWILDTRPHSVGSLTAVTDEQLRTKTWAEVGKWHQMSMTEHWFNYNSSRGNMSLIHKEHPKWRADARTARKEKSESFAGQHSPTATSFYIFDEASGVEPEVFKVREGGLSSGEPMVFDFGNGTQSTGAFYEECEGRLKSRYIRRSIDSRTVAITNKDKIKQDADDYGEDSDFFRVRWQGLFPEQGFSQFISTAEVDEAMDRPGVDDTFHPLVFGVDVARFGDDDTVIFPRRGRDARSFAPKRLSGFSTDEVLAAIVEYYNYFTGLGTRPQMIFVDLGNTGGAIVDFLAKMGYPVTGLWFGGGATNKITYRFRGDEMWGNMRAAIKGGLVLPARNSEHGDRIHTDLSQRMYGFLKGTERIHLEPKDMMKARGVKSPDFGDALALTYATEVAIIPGGLKGPGGQVEADYDPFKDI